MRFAWIEEPPFNFRDGDAVTGCDVELARHVCGVLGEAFEPVETDFARLLPGLADGCWDVTTGMFVTPARAARAAFTRPIWALADGLLVKGDAVRSVAGYRGVAAREIRLAVLRDQAQHDTALANGIPADRISIFETYAEAADAVASGAVEAYASVGRAHLGFLARSTDRSLACVPVPDAEKKAEPGAFACADRALRDRIDAVLSGFLGTPIHREMLSSFGFGEDEIAAGLR